MAHSYSSMDSIYLNQLSGVVQGSLLANLVHESGLWVLVGHFCWYINFVSSFVLDSLIGVQNVDDGIIA